MDQPPYATAFPATAVGHSGYDASTVVGGINGG
jgi:hypothetical protein